MAIDYRIYPGLKTSLGTQPRFFVPKEGPILKIAPPVHFASCLFLGLIAIIFLERQSSISEVQGFVFSGIIASMVWLIGLKLIIKHNLDGQTIRLLNILFFLKIILGWIHYQYLFMPASGISTTQSFAMVHFEGDLVPIYFSAIQFVRERGLWGLWWALTGDYYRQINNPGVGVIYGLLFGTFGNHPVVAVPWNALAMGLSCLLINVLSAFLRLSKSITLLAMILTFLMPSFIIGPPLYRDQFMIFLILLSVYSLLHALWTHSIWSGSVCLIASLLLGSLRGIYLALPLVTLVSALIVRPKQSKDVFPFLLVISILTVGGILYLNNVLGMLYEDVAYTGALGSWFGSRGIGGFIAKFVFMQLSPFPWYQDAPSWLLVYQVFDYGQTLLGLTVVTALVIGWREIWFEHGHDSRTLVVVGFFLMLSAAVGSALHQRYAQIALPLLIVPSVPVLQRRWPMCLFVSSLIIVSAHLAFGILK